MTNLEVYIISIWELISSEVPSLEQKKNLNSWYIPERPSCFEDIRTEPLKSDTLFAGLPQSPGKLTCLLGNPKLKIRQDEGITGKNHRFLKKTYFRIVALGAWLVFVGRFVYIFPLTLNKIHHLSRWNPMILCATSNFLYISKHFGLRRDFWDHQPPRCVAFPFFAFFFFWSLLKSHPVSMGSQFSDSRICRRVVTTMIYHGNLKPSGRGWWKFHGIEIQSLRKLHRPDDAPWDGTY